MVECHLVDHISTPVFLGILAMTLATQSWVISILCQAKRRLCRFYQSEFDGLGRYCKVYRS